jgi:hypothetical protein
MWRTTAGVTGPGALRQRIMYDRKITLQLARNSTLAIRARHAASIARRGYPSARTVGRAITSI